MTYGELIFCLVFMVVNIVSLWFLCSMIFTPEPPPVKRKDSDSAERKDSDPSDHDIFVWPNGEWVFRFHWSESMHGTSGPYRVLPYHSDVWDVFVILALRDGITEDNLKVVAV
ncbi:TPA: hypothetical protein P5S08_003737 [Salmonella enterica subsp. enterica serovar Concord]|nr:hypothetical protein [Salmonella enterica subsp. enterica serovar Concord]